MILRLKAVASSGVELAMIGLTARSH
jgi:hypothetical protein